MIGTSTNTILPTLGPNVGTVVAAFERESDLKGAVGGLQRSGIAPDGLGSIIGEISDGLHGCLLSVQAPPNEMSDIVALLQDCGAKQIGQPSEMARLYGRVPHPGIIEDHDLKLPAGRSYPEATWPPALGGYRGRQRTLDEKARIWNFEEVELGYTREEALREANRCLRCPEPGCVKGCPAHNDIPGFVDALRQGDLARAITVLRRTANLPGICGRVCDSARQCEGGCVLGHEGGDAVAIGLLERFLADSDQNDKWRRQRALAKASPTDKRVAIVGSGASGLAAAGDLAFLGHAVTVFDTLPVVGGAMAWGIPAFRLPPSVLHGEIALLEGLGVEFRLNVKVGTSPSIDDLFAQGFDAVYVGVGTTLATRLGVPGEDLDGIYTATEFLSRAKLSRMPLSPKFQPPVVGERLAVIGGGNTAMDVAQTALRLANAASLEGQSEGRQTGQTTMDVAETALRLGFREVTVLYRRSEADMPARREEVDSAREEGTRFRFLCAPVRFIGDNRGRVAAMDCVEMVAGKRDRHSRREPMPKPGTEFRMEVDTVILALGYQPDPAFTQGIHGITVSREALVVAQGNAGRTGRVGLWAGGDVVSGPATVVRAMVAGKRTALDIHRFLSEQRN